MIIEEIGLDDGLIALNADAMGTASHRQRA